ncbi:MAG: hypothetical protein EOP83_13435 [Verrucomicrobiaceae bacterium]|nr:MAG: hypothetical protein EOP83_13435 [Verrucomicrobiaceae bacterium]
MKHETHDERVEREIAEQRQAAKDARTREHAERMNYVADLRRAGVHEDNLRNRMRERFGEY